MTKILKADRQGMCLNIIKVIYNKFIDNILPSSFLLGSGTRQGYPLSPVLFHIVSEALTTATREEKEKKSKLQRKESNWHCLRTT